ncbi:YihY/virulence factor BrkB family protein [Geminicoccus roseus]|uniref:YihY/virulence factor BrkB family protein n=1 Tax=Geminicoccus roseus TaxID=404900 RepID=UPI0012FC5BA9|nr:YihY/virulence factor BrkB family protein [Geminicoccus roseus]
MPSWDKLRLAARDWRCDFNAMDAAHALAPRPPISVRKIAQRAFTRFLIDDGLTHAAAIAFDSLFALVPFLIFLLTLAGWVGQSEAATQSIDLALTLLPPEVAGWVKPLVNEVRRGAHPSILTLSMVGTLWVASSAVEAVRNALNRIFDATVSAKDWPMRRLQGLLLTFFAGFCAIALTTLTLVLPIGLQLAAQLLHDPEITMIVGSWSSHLTGVAILFVISMTLFRLLPGRRIPLTRLAIGALFVAVVWNVLVFAFSYYMRNVSSMSVTYGSLGGVVVTMFFFWLSAVIFLLGAELAAAVDRASTPSPLSAPLAHG